MEAVPKLPLLSFELKVSPENTRFGSKLKRYISEAYREDPESYNNEIHQLEGLRSAAVRPTTDAAGLAALYRYFCQIRGLQSRFPMGIGQPVAVTFSWKDLYANMSCSPPDIRFEMASILYNIGALHTELGASEPRTTADSLKAACTHFQNAAWAFQHLREQYDQPPGVDVSSEIMRLLQEICFAQAQECILEKSIQDTRKPSVVGAVATQVLFFYKNALALLGPSTSTEVHEIIGTRLFNHWHRWLSFRTFYIGCIVCLYQGMHAEEQQKMGERVAFYQLSVEKLGEARKLAKYIDPVQVTQEALTFTNDVVEGKRKAAKNENEFIYHEEVPEKDLLMDMKPVCLVKALPINFKDPEVSGPDIFARLVPMVAHEASSVYSEEKAKLLRQIISQVEAKNTEMKEFMSSLQLDQLEIIDSDQKIPEEIVDRCASMNAKTEVIQTLVDSMNNLAEIISDVEHSLAEIKDAIQEDTLKEKEYQKVMGPRPPSIVQTELSREYHKYLEAHTRTNESNQVLHKAMTLHIANLRLLSQPLDVLESKIPSIENIEGLDRETMMEMRRVVGKAREMQTQRDSLVQQLREAVANDDITAQLLARSTEPPEEVYKVELEKHTPKKKIIEQNLAAQENIINRLTSLYAAYGESRRLLTDVLRKREGLINALVTSYDTYEELLGKCQKGLEFYRRLAHSVAQLHARLRSTCQVQREERAHLLATHTNTNTNKRDPAPTPTPSTVSKTTDVIPSPTGGVPRKLKDYLPYMKNRTLPRSVAPHAQIDPIPSETYYPESIYPTSVRPTPVGSEATDPSQMQLPDGVVMPQMQNLQNPYDRYATPYAPTEHEPYSVPSNYMYPATSKAYDKMSDDGSKYGYSTPYTPSQYSNQGPDPQHQIYSNPCYSATHNSSTIVTDSQNPVPYTNINQANVAPNNQYNMYPDQYMQNNQLGQMPEAPAVSSYSGTNQANFNVNFAQMHISGPKSEQPNYGAEYSHTYYSVQYPQVSTPNVATYSNAVQNSNTSMASKITSDYSSLNYPYSSESQYGPTINTNVSFAGADPQYSQAVAYSNASQSYPVYTNADTTLTTNMANTVATPQTYNPYSETDSNYPHQSQLDAIDKPIKSHVTGEALSTVSYQPTYQTYDANAQNYTNPQPNPEQNYQPTNAYPYSDQTNQNYGQNYQNHPGYNFNTATGNYDYNYGSQNTNMYDNAGQANVNPQSFDNSANCPVQGVYTSAGTCETLQSPSEMPQSSMQPQNDQIYYNVPYGYLTTTNQSSEGVPSSEPVSTNYGANMNQSTYMQSGHERDTSVTFTNNQVSSPTENITEPPNFSEAQNHSTNQNVVGTNDQNTAYDQSSETVTNENTVTVNSQNAGYVTNQVAENVSNQNVNNKSEQYSNNQHPGYSNQTEIKKEPEAVENPEEIQPESKPEPSVFDLLSDIDFTVEHKPLMPEIKVPQISESAIKKPVTMPKVEPVRKIVPKVEVIERPAKRDIFTDPSLMNKFTQEVKNLQKLVDSLTEKTAGGITLLDSKWKTFQDVQTKENMTRSKTIAMQYTNGNIVTEVVPFDDTRLTLKSDPDAFINASYYKQLAPWCVPLVISKNPTEHDYSLFWKAVLENKISCIVCLLSEIEMQGKSYWPTAKGQSLDLSGNIKVVLDDVACTVHWTERKLTVASGKTVLNVTHYQINVFPAKIVCSPLVLLADKMLSATYDNRLSNQLCGVWVQCGAGAGRSAVLSLLVVVMCQVRAGYMDLCEMLDAACIHLCKHRSNVLEDTKYLADAYRTALFYVQGVLCSGTTMFNGEAVSLPSGASILPPVTPTPTASQKPYKFSRESFEEMKQSPGLKSGDMKDPLNFLDPLWSLKKK